MSDEMVYEACVEVRPDGTAIAQICDMPAAFARGSNEPDAVATLEERLPAYFAWLSRHDEYTPVMRGPFRVVLAEAQRLTDPTVGAFFQFDAQPLPDADVDWYTALLDWSYADFIAALRAAPASDQARQAAQRVAQAQLWLLSRLGPVNPQELATLQQLAAGTSDALVEQVRALALRRLRALDQPARQQVTETDGERWSARKLLRRSILLVREATPQS